MIIAIAGASGSGKSTLASALAERFERDGARVLSVSSDKYFKKDLPKMVSPADGREYPDWNHPDSFDADALRRDLCAARDSGDWDVVLFEGVTIFCHHDLRALADVRIWVDASIEARIARRIARNVVTKGQSVEFIMDYYLRCARVRERKFALPSRVYADFAVNNDYGFEFDADAVYEKVQRLKHE
jgi:uridine kinase